MDGWMKCAVRGDVTEILEAERESIQWCVIKWEEDDEIFGGFMMISDFKGVNFVDKVKNKKS